MFYVRLTIFERTLSGYLQGAFLYYQANGFACRRL